MYPRTDLGRWLLQGQIKAVKLLQKVLEMEATLEVPWE